MSSDPSAGMNAPRGSPAGKRVEGSPTGGDDDRKKRRMRSPPPSGRSLDGDFAENAATGGHGDAEQRLSRSPSPDNRGAQTASDGIATIPMPEHLKLEDVAPFGLFKSAVTTDCIQLNAILREPVKDSPVAQKSLTMHVVKFKASPHEIPEDIAKLSIRNPATGAGYHSLVLHDTVVSFVPALTQSMAEHQAGKKVDRYQHPCVIMVKRKYMWKLCQRLINTFNHAVQEVLGRERRLNNWEPMKLAPYVETDGVNGWGMMANIDDSEVIPSAYFEGSATVYGPVKVVLKLLPPIGYMSAEVQAKGIHAYSGVTMTPSLKLKELMPGCRNINAIKIGTYKTISTSTVTECKPSVADLEEVFEMIRGEGTADDEQDFSSRAAIVMHNTAAASQANVNAVNEWMSRSADKKVTLDKSTSASTVGQSIRQVATKTTFTAEDSDDDGVYMSRT